MKHTENAQNGTRPACHRIGCVIGRCSDPPSTRAGGPSKDACSPEGGTVYFNIVSLILWFGIVCSSWVWMCRSGTHRSHVNILGAATDTVQNANAMVSRVIMLFQLAVALGHAVFLEQPITSLMELHNRFQDLSHVLIICLCLLLVMCFVLLICLSCFCLSKPRPLKRNLQRHHTIKLQAKSKLSVALLHGRVG